MYCAPAFVSVRRHCPRPLLLGATAAEAPARIGNRIPELGRRAGGEEGRGVRAVWRPCDSTFPLLLRPSIPSFLGGHHTPLPHHCRPPSYPPFACHPASPYFHIARDAHQRARVRKAGACARPTRPSLRAPAAAISFVPLALPVSCFAANDRSAEHYRPFLSKGKRLPLYERVDGVQRVPRTVTTAS